MRAGFTAAWPSPRTGALRTNHVTAAIVVSLLCTLSARRPKPARDVEGDGRRERAGNLKGRMLKTMTYRVVDQLFIVVYGDANVTDDDWVSYLRAVELHGFDRTTQLC